MIQAILNATWKGFLLDDKITMRLEKYRMQGYLLIDLSAQVFFNMKALVIF
jgi:hypothetical protein